MRNLFNLFGLLDRGRGDRRGASHGRAYPQTAPAARRYERPEVGRAEYARPDYSRPEYRADRRRPQQEVNWRRRGMFALTGLVAGASIAGGVWLYESPVFRVRVIDIQGAQIADAQEIAKAAGVSGSSMLTLSLDRAEQAVAKLPAVKTASVTRDWPHGVRIDVTEYQAWGYWQAGPERLVIDETGRVLEQSRPPAADAPTIVEVASAAPDAKGVTTDPDTVRLVHRLRTDGTFDRLKVKPTSYIFRRDRGLTVIVADGPAAVLGDSSNYEFKVRTWAALLDQVRAGQVPRVQAMQGLATATPRAGQSEAMASEIDLRFGRNVVLR
ncbi:MAG: FtsQ-type POTRA domain-containing protein [Chloroflexi bacterium]|nr:FtsQ-type POTRA domain-containing protein [Chloroflexota bacterium]